MIIFFVKMYRVVQEALKLPLVVSQLVLFCVF